MAGHILGKRWVVTVRPGKTDLSISGWSEGAAARAATARGRAAGRSALAGRSGLGRGRLLGRLSSRSSLGDSGRCCDRDRGARLRPAAFARGGTLGALRDIYAMMTLRHAHRMAVLRECGHRRRVERAEKNSERRNREKIDKLGEGHF